MVKFMDRFSLWHSIIIAILGGVLIILFYDYHIWLLTLGIYIILGVGFIFIGYNITKNLIKRENLKK